jgi:hypothetical protein
MSPARFWLGMAQMGMATVALVFLVVTGVSSVTIAATLIATTFTILSRSLYRGHERSLLSSVRRKASTKS